MSSGEHFVWSAIGLEDIKDLSRVMDVSGGVIFSEMDAQEKTMISKEEHVRKKEEKRMKEEEEKRMQEEKQREREKKQQEEQRMWDERMHDGPHAYKMQ